jgi:hypothetical protein
MCFPSQKLQNLMPKNHSKLFLKLGMLQILTKTI